MSRLVMIEIPDNVGADNFIKAVEAGDVIFGVSDENGENKQYQAIEAKVEAVWAKPTQFCECPDYNGTSAPTKKYRWMVHAKCAKPHKGSMQHPRDLTRADWKANEIPYYLGFRADSKGWVYRKEPS